MYTYIYRVVCKDGVFESVWVTSLAEAKRMKKKVENDILGKLWGTKYEIEKNELKI